MNKIELANLLLSANFPKNSYSIDEVSNESLCLIFDGSVWKIFYSERGHRNEEKSYANESDACDIFLAELKYMLRR